jgi:hypothetical protein
LPASLFNLLMESWDSARCSCASAEILPLIKLFVFYRCMSICYASINDTSKSWNAILRRRALQVRIFFDGNWYFFWYSQYFQLACLGSGCRCRPFFAGR